MTSAALNDAHSKPTSGAQSISLFYTKVSFVQRVNSSITKHSILKRILSLINTFHHLFIDASHCKCYDCLKEDSEGKGDAKYNGKF